MILRAPTAAALELLAAPLRAAGYVAAGRWVKIAGEFVQAFRRGSDVPIPGELQYRAT